MNQDALWARRNLELKRATFQNAKNSPVKPVQRGYIRGEHLLFKKTSTDDKFPEEIILKIPGT